MSMSYEPRAHGALCDECPLKDRRPVPPQGPKSASLAIVGEGPGWNEERLGKPFVGVSGRALDNLLNHYGFARTEILISNATLCRPPDLQLGSIASEDADSDPKKVKAAMRCCKPRLDRELASLSNLKTIIALGAIAHRAVTGKSTGIQKSRGFVWEGSVGEEEEEREITILPTVHPAFVLRSPSWEPVIETDFDRAKRVCDGSYSPIEFESVLAPKLGDLSSVLARLKDPIAVDIETTRIGATSCKMLCVGVSDGDLAVVVPWASTKTPGRSYYGRDKQPIVTRKVREALKARTCVTHNGPGFDEVVLARYGIDLKEKEDTLLAHHAFASHMPQRLDHVVSMYLDAPPWKIVARRGARQDEKGAWDPQRLANEELWTYNAMDACFTVRAWQAMASDLEPERSVYETDKRLASLCRGMQERGVAVDRARRDELRRELQGRQNRYLGELRRRVGFQLVPTRLDHIRKALFRVLHAPVLFRSVKTGLPSTDVNTLQALAMTETKAGAWCRILLKWRSAWKQRSTYVDGIDLEKDGRVHPSWRAWGTVSGRFSSRQPNLQNLTRGSMIRSMYVAPKGRVLTGYDHSQLEMRLAAYLSGDDAFIRACESTDLHAANAEILFGQLPPKGTDEYKKLRTMAKTSGFAVSYMAQASTVHAKLLADGFRVELRQVEAMLDRMRKSYSGYYDWQGKNIEAVEKDGFLRLAMSGRKRWFGHVPMPTEIVNYPIQGGAADVMNSKLPEIEDALPRGSFIVAQVHDQAIIECDRRQADRVSKLCKSIAERPVKIGERDVVFPVEVKVGERWSEV